MPRKPQPKTDHPDVVALQSLILWARREQVTLTHVTVGGVEVVMHDAKASAILAEREPKADNEARKNIYEEMGGALFAEAGQPAAETVEPTVEDDDE